MASGDQPPAPKPGVLWYRTQRYSVADGAINGALATTGEEVAPEGPRVPAGAGLRGDRTTAFQCVLWSWRGLIGGLRIALGFQRYDVAQLGPKFIGDGAGFAAVAYHPGRDQDQEFSPDQLILGAAEQFAQ